MCKLGLGISLSNGEEKGSKKTVQMWKEVYSHLSKTRV